MCSQSRGADNFLEACGAKCQNHLFCGAIKGKMRHKPPNFGNLVVAIDLRLVAASGDIPIGSDFFRVPFRSSGICR